MELREVERDNVLLCDFLGLICTVFGDSVGRMTRAGLALGV